MKKKKRLSQFQEVVLRSLKRNRRKMDYEELRDEVMDILRIDWAREESFKASFSRSLSNLEAKKWIKRDIYGWRISRCNLIWDDVQLTKRGLSQIEKR